MERSEDTLENNTARLIQAGMGGEAHPDTQARQALYRRLVEEVNARARASAFPEKALGMLASLWLLATFVLLAQFSQMGMRLLESGLWPLLLPFLLLNLGLAPVASIVIIIQRRSHETTD